MTEPLNFQSIIMTLQQFWAEQNCLIWQPYYTQVGAGTMNPATYLRVLGPEPWRVAYVEPSIRPDDGRYGENPNRMQMHYQFQVILKPDPGNPQEIYLKSLEALGINPAEHDIRFVEDNWEQPALGAWGLGWEVWLDGQEITQFTYFQQAGGHMLDPVSVELTYGLERIAIALQRVRSFTEIQWSHFFSDGDVNLQAEQEHSAYYFETADVERLRRMYDLFEAEARVCLEKGLVLPAHDYILKCSHTFNVLDTRGAVGVTERQAMFGRMRDLARQVTTAYLDQRQRLEYPWLDRPVGGSMDAQPAPPLSTADFPVPAEAAPFLLEVGTEELPVDDLDGALAQLRSAVPVLLDELRLAHGAVQVLGTPRRLVVSVENLAPRQADLEQVVKGPPADRAFDRFGDPTRAAEGFARSKSIGVEDLQVREMDGGRYVVALVRESGRPAGEVLSQALPELIGALRFEKTMRWNSTNVSFSRPIRWLLALFGEQPLAFGFAGVRSGNTTRGLRMREPAVLTVGNPAEYFSQLDAQGIILDVEERRNRIRAEVEALATEVGGDAEMEPALLAEVANLVEAPRALRGAFNPAHLELPREVLVSVMKKHQRYIPVVAEGSGEARPLMPYFIAVRNGDDQGMELVVEGNEHVIRARFADAAFFVREDLEQPLEAYLPKLDRLTFQARLGSMLDKTRRLEQLVDEVGAQIGLTGEELAHTRRAAHLAKADLATQMVVEMTSLQGIMGRRYAAASGEPEPVAVAIFEHYLPRYAGDLTPASRPGLAVGLADRLDSLVGLFAAGLAPSGNKDPFALRRAAQGLVQSLLSWDLDFDLRPAVDSAAKIQPIPVPDEAQSAVLDFVAERLRHSLLEDNYRYDVVEAVLAAQGHNPARAVRAVKSLSKWVDRPDWDRILPAYARCVRITRDLDERYAVSPDRFEEPAERELYAAHKTAEAARGRGAAGLVDGFLEAFLPMIPAIDRFFDQVLVMAEDPDLRRNRLGLLQEIVSLADGVADFSRLEGF